MRYLEEKILEKKLKKKNYDYVVNLGGMLTTQIKVKLS